MYNKEFALRIKEKVYEKKVVLISDKSDFILGYRTLKYYYSDEETKKKHTKVLEREGYKAYEGSETLYCDIYNPNETVRIIMKIYEKNVYEEIK